MRDQYFKKMAPVLMRKLMRDFDLDKVSAAAVAGNLGHESGGFQQLQEKKPLVPGSRGGYGLPQWTGPRRRAYEAYCKRTGKDPAAFESNYAYLFLELKGIEGNERGVIEKLKRAQGLEGKVKAFELAFLRASPKYKHYPSRNTWAKKALLAYELEEKSVSLPTEIARPKVKVEEKEKEMTMTRGTKWLLGLIFLVVLVVIAAKAMAQEVIVEEPTLGSRVADWVISFVGAAITAIMAAVSWYVRNWLVEKSFLTRKQADTLVGQNLDAAARKAISLARLKVGTTIAEAVDDITAQNMVVKYAAAYLIPKFQETMDDMGFSPEDIEEFIRARLGLPEDTAVTLTAPVTAPSQLVSSPSLEEQVAEAVKREMAKRKAPRTKVK